jgi:hypothetical protein
MGVFLGTLIIFGICCLAMSSSLLFSGKPLSGGCGSKPAGAQRCEDCPNKHRHRPVADESEGESL